MYLGIATMGRTIYGVENGWEGDLPPVAEHRDLFPPKRDADLLEASPIRPQVRGGLAATRRAELYERIVRSKVEFGIVNRRLSEKVRGAELCTEVALAVGLCDLAA
jgi:hypothetical protein|tara:strand:+ start:329 stop:646 length:318 start_codon:yes stop_codon:yes gene_type:complete